MLRVLFLAMKWLLVVLRSVFTLYPILILSGLILKRSSVPFLLSMTKLLTLVSPGALAGCILRIVLVKLAVLPVVLLVVDMFRLMSTGTPRLPVVVTLMVGL